MADLIQPYLKHDDNASQDRKIMRLSLDFRKIAKSMSREELESFVSHGAYALFWQILEYMHSNKLMSDDIEMLADNLRVDSKYINKILNDYELFRLDEDEYVSDRLLRDMEKQREKSQKASESANIRYLLSAFNSAYKEFFGEEPILESDEIEVLKKYDKKIPDFKNKFRDILYTLRNLKFDTDINFKPCANWLLKNKHLSQLLNGEFGPLLHKKTESEIKAEQKRAEEERAKQEEPNKQLEIQTEQISGKAEAIEFIKDYYKDRQILFVKNRAVIPVPALRKLINRFDIQDSEFKERGEDDE